MTLTRICSPNGQVNYSGRLPMLKYLCNHPDLSQKTKEKIAYDNGKEYFQLNRPASAHAGRKAN